MYGLPRYVLGRIACEKGDNFCDVLRFSGMTERNSFGCGLPFRIAIIRPDARRGDSTGRDGIDANAAGRQF
jgi:hypothetical protein